MPLALLFLELLEPLELLVMAPLVALKQSPDRSHTPAVFAASELNKCSPHPLVHAPCCREMDVYPNASQPTYLNFLYESKTDLLLPMGCGKTM